MTEQEVLDRLNQPNSSAERLLEECVGTDGKLRNGDARLYRGFTEKLIEQGYPARAFELARVGQEFLSEDVAFQYLLALAARRCGNPRYALMLLKPLLPKAADPQSSLPIKLRVDVVALHGSVLKVLSRTSPELLVESARAYEQAANLSGAVEMSDRGTFPLINAATVWRLAGNLDRSSKLAHEVLLRAAKMSEGSGDPLWHPATLGEANLLIGEHAAAADFYVQAAHAAIANNRQGELASVRMNLEMLRSAGATANPEFIDQYLGSVVVFGGHMIDSPERQRSGQPSRFPNSPKLIEAVSTAISIALENINAKVGFCSLACGGDLLFAKAMIDRNAELHVVLPFDQHDFLRTSVNFGQISPEWRKWRVMFESVLDAVPENRVRYATKEPFLGSDGLFHFSNRVLQGMAVLRARERASLPQAVVLLDTSAPGRIGGARSFAEAWAASGYKAESIDLAILRTQVAEPIHPNAKRDTPAAPPATSKLKRPVKALLFADVAGFSGIPEWQLSDYLEDYGRFLREVFASTIGASANYVNTWGDAVYAVFDRVQDAAALALELLEPTVATSPKWADYGMGDSSPYRVGLHSGPVFELPDIFQGRSAFSGQHVSRAARIEPATMQGCAYASEQFAAWLTMESDPRFHIESAGVHQLPKGYDRCQLYRIARGTAC